MYISVLLHLMIFKLQGPVEKTDTPRVSSSLPDDMKRLRGANTLEIFQMDCDAQNTDTMIWL